MIHHRIASQVTTLEILQAARMRFVVDNEPYCLNLIDTPGHVDFSYEASNFASIV